MNRLIACLATLVLLICVCPTFANSDAMHAAFNAKPAVSVNFDGSHRLDVTRKQQCPPQQEQTQSNIPGDSLVFEKQDSIPSTPILVGVGVLAVALGAAYQLHQIGKTVTAVR